MLWSCFDLDSMLIFEVLWNGEVVSRELVPKDAKSAFLDKNHEVVPVPKQGGIGTTQQNPFGTGTDTSGTGTTMQNVFGTGTKHSGTGTIVSKMPRFL